MMSPRAPGGLRLSRPRFATEGLPCACTSSMFAHVLANVNDIQVSCKAGWVEVMWLCDNFFKSIDWLTLWQKPRCHKLGILTQRVSLAPHKLKRFVGLDSRANLNSTNSEPKPKCKVSVAPLKIHNKRKNCKSLTFFWNK